MPTTLNTSTVDETKEEGEGEGILRNRTTWGTRVTRGVGGRGKEGGEVVEGEEGEEEEEEVPVEGGDATGDIPREAHVEVFLKFSSRGLKFTSHLCNSQVAVTSISSNLRCNISTAPCQAGGQGACSILHSVALCITTPPFCPPWTKGHCMTTLGSKCKHCHHCICLLILFVCLCFREYYFSDENLQKDFFLRRQVCVIILLTVPPPPPPSSIFET